MRIRQIRPEFFTDATMASLSAEVKLTYIGLWIVADDAGYLRLDLTTIGAVLYPYQPVKRRERHLALACDQLVAAGRLVRYDCGCALIPTLSRHQRVTGKTSTTAKDAHLRHDMEGRERPVNPTVREQVLERDGLECRYCGKEVEPKTLVLAHLDPRELATASNLVVACRRCNWKQSSKTYQDAGFDLIQVPVAPKRYHSLTSTPLVAPVGNGNGRERNGSGTVVAPESSDEPTTSEFRQKVAQPA